MARRTNPAPGGALRVVHVIPRLSPTGGAETSLVQVVEPLRRLGVASEVVVLTEHPDNRPARALREAGVTVHVLGEVSRPRQVLRLVRILRRSRPDVVHTTLLEAGLVGRLAARLTGRPALHSVVNSVYRGGALTAYGAAWKTRLFFVADFVLARVATTRFHVLTEASADEVTSTFRVPRERISVVPRGRSTALLGARTAERRAAARRGLGIDNDRSLVVNVARQERQKGHVDLVRAFAVVRETLPDAELAIAGRPGAATRALEAAIRDEGLVDHVRLLGSVDDVGSLLCAADVFAFSSHWEGLGGAVLEAMALEVPIVTFAVPAVCEVVGDTAVVVPIGDVSALAKAVTGILIDRDRGAAGAAAARSRFDVHFTLDGVAGQMADLYRDVAGRNGDRAGSAA